MQGTYGVWKRMEKILVLFRPGKVWKKIIGLLVWKKEMIFLTSSFNMHSNNILF